MSTIKKLFDMDGTFWGDSFVRNILESFYKYELISKMRSGNDSSNQGIYV